MAQNKTERLGYIYNSKTHAGFLRMQRQGIPRVPFRVESNITRTLSKLYKAEIENITLEFVEQALNANAKMKGTVITADGIKEDILKQVKERGNIAGFTSEALNKGAVGIAIAILKKKWFENTDLKESTKAELRKRLSVEFESGKNNFYKQFMKDADYKMQNIIANFSLDKKEVFESRIEELKKLYIDNALQRIEGEENELKKMYLRRLTDYALGKTESLDVASLAREMSTTSVHVARFFARDQMARFNKALTLTTFEQAGVKKIKWCTCRDGRVRKSHQKLDGKIFDADDLPSEIDDYNCRCGLVPVWN